jgi:xanthine dehydrogenase YagT iron-sulfur-binding subunit
MPKAQPLVVGSPAPCIDIGGRAGSVLSLPPRGARPTVLVFLDEAPPDGRAGRPHLDAIRAELRGLGAMLVVASARGLWTFRPDDEIEVFASPPDVDGRDLERAQHAYGIAPLHEGGGALFVIDEAATIRFAHEFHEAEGRALPLLAGALSIAGEALATRPAPSRASFSRREVVVGALVAGLTLAFLDACARRPPPPAPAAPGPGPFSTTVGEADVTFIVNGAPRTVRVDPRVTLLDALRERLGLTGSKKGCDMGQCGACTVLVDGRRINSCLTLAVAVAGATIVTIEGLAQGDTLHPLQTAFVELDAQQCGYCTPGQILSGVALLREGHARTDAEVREQMSGNICRCGAYPHIVAAIQRARKAV